MRPGQNLGAAGAQPPVGVRPLPVHPGDDGYVRTVMDRYGVHTKTEAVDLALRHLAGQPMTRDEALAMRGAHALDDIPADPELRPGA